MIGHDVGGFFGMGGQRPWKEDRPGGACRVRTKLVKLRAVFVASDRAASTRPCSGTRPVQVGTSKGVLVTAWDW